MHARQYAHFVSLLEIAQANGAHVWVIIHIHLPFVKALGKPSQDFRAACPPTSASSTSSSLCITNRYIPTWNMCIYSLNLSSSSSIVLTSVLILIFLILRLVFPEYDWRRSQHTAGSSE